MIVWLVSSLVVNLLAVVVTIRRSHRIGYLEGQLLAWEERWREHQSLFHGPLSGAPTSMLATRSFSVASHSDIFGGMDASGPAHDFLGGLAVGDGWNNYGGATGPAGVWAQRDRDRREEWARRDRNR